MQERKTVRLGNCKLISWAKKTPVSKNVEDKHLQKSQLMEKNV